MCADRLALFAALLAAPACSSPSGPAAGPQGNFVGTPRLGEPFLHLSVSLRQVGDSLMGKGYINHTSVPVSGSYDAPNVHLLLPSSNPQVLISFDGQVDDAGMTGVIRFGSQAPFAFEFTRVDTAATGEATLVLTGAIARTERPSASFTYVPQEGVVTLGLGSPGPAPSTVVHISWDGLDYPRAGTYVLRTDGSLPSAGVFSVGGSGTDPVVQGGEVVIEVARRHALIGRLNLTAALPGGSTISVAGTFSAGCTGSLC